MASRQVTVTAPSRLHFGLLSFGNPELPSFGGSGVMIQRPATVLRIRSADHFEISGLLSERTGTFAAKWAAYHAIELPACELNILSAPDEHIGLGVGTQLGLSVAAGLSSWMKMEIADPIVLAKSVGRGARSAIGTHGFVRGGLLFETGKREEIDISPLESRISIPSEWRFILVQIRHMAGLSGAREVDAFQSLPIVPTNVSQELHKILVESLLPAARAGHFHDFGESVYRFGRLAGKCFADVQGGPFANSQLENWVHRIRALGLAGVGQSSWGPTLYAVASSQAQALDIIDQLRNTIPENEANISISEPNNCGACIDIQEDRSGS